MATAKLRPHLAPLPPEEERRVVLPERLRALAGGERRRALPRLVRALVAPQAGLSRRYVLGQLVISLIPAIVLAVGFSVVYLGVRTGGLPEVVPADTVQPGGGSLAEPPDRGGAPSSEPPVAEPTAAGLAEPPGAETAPESPRGGGLAEPPGAETAPESPRAPGGLAEPPGAEPAPESPRGGGLAEPPGAETAPESAREPGGLAEPPGAETAPESPRETGGLAEPPGAEAPGAAAPASPATRATGGQTDPAQSASSTSLPVAFWIALAIGLLLLAVHYTIFTFERLEILKMLLTSFFPLTVLILMVLGSIIFGWATPTEAAALGAAGAMLLTGVYRQFTWRVLKESVFLTAKTSAMVCWLFVGSSIFSAAFALLGGQALVETWVLGLDLSPLQFMLLAQVIIFLLGWPLEWTEIIVIFMPIFIPLLDHFAIDPLFFGLMVALNLQTAFLSPPVAMAAFYLKGVAPPHVTLNQIFAGMMPFMVIQVIAMVLLYLFPQIGLWLPEVLYR
jgi:TRAP-type mannitol/chloroaromatic compound transport system permease large subunit